MPTSFPAPACLRGGENAGGLLFARFVGQEEDERSVFGDEILLLVGGVHYLDALLLDAVALRELVEDGVCAVKLQVLLEIGVVHPVAEGSDAYLVVAFLLHPFGHLRNALLFALAQVCAVFGKVHPDVHTVLQDARELQQGAARAVRAGGGAVGRGGTHAVFYLGQHFPHLVDLPVELLHLHGVARGGRVALEGARPYGVAQAGVEAQEQAAGGVFHLEDGAVVGDVALHLAEKVEVAVQGDAGLGAEREDEGLQARFGGTGHADAGQRQHAEATVGAPAAAQRDGVEQHLAAPYLERFVVMLVARGCSAELHGPIGVNPFSREPRQAIAALAARAVAVGADVFVRKAQPPAAANADERVAAPLVAISLRLPVGRLLPVAGKGRSAQHEGGGNEKCKFFHEQMVLSDDEGLDGLYFALASVGGAHDDGRHIELFAAPQLLYFLYLLPREAVAACFERGDALVGVDEDGVEAHHAEVYVDEIARIGGRELRVGGEVVFAHGCASAVAVSASAGGIADGGCGLGQLAHGEAARAHRLSAGLNGHGGLPAVGSAERPPALGAGNASVVGGELQGGIGVAAVEYFEGVADAGIQEVHLLGEERDQCLLRLVVFGLGRGLHGGGVGHAQELAQRLVGGQQYVFLNLVQQDDAPDGGQRREVVFFPAVSRFRLRAEKARHDLARRAVVELPQQQGAQGLDVGAQLFSVVLCGRQHDVGHGFHVLSLDEAARLVVVLVGPSRDALSEAVGAGAERLRGAGNAVGLGREPIDAALPAEGREAFVHFAQGAVLLLRVEGEHGEALHDVARHVNGHHGQEHDVDEVDHLLPWGQIERCHLTFPL